MSVLLFIILVCCWLVDELLLLYNANIEFLSIGAFLTFVKLLISSFNELLLLLALIISCSVLLDSLCGYGNERPLKSESLVSKNDFSFVFATSGCCF